MTRPAEWGALLLLLGLAHTGCSGQAPEHARSSPAKSAPQAPASATPLEAGEPTPKCSQESPLALQLQAHVSPAGIGLSVLNGGPKSVRLSSVVALVDANGQTLDAEALHVQRTCAAEPCVTLDPGAELLSPPWLGSSNGERCGSLVRPSSQPGTYQLIVRSCECKHEQRVAVQWPPS
jgi:hypothetical protein